eukprot:980601-Pyramimonas_sp.AAC.1
MLRFHSPKPTPTRRAFRTGKRRSKGWGSTPRAIYYDARKELTGELNSRVTRWLNKVLTVRVSPCKGFRACVALSTKALSKSAPGALRGFADAKVLGRDNSVNCRWAREYPAKLLGWCRQSFGLQNVSYNKSLYRSRRAVARGDNTGGG